MEQEGAQEQQLRRKLDLTTKTQHHPPQPRAFHSRQWHVAVSNYQNKILNEPHLNLVRFFVTPNTSKKISDGCKCDRCPTFTFMFLIIISMF
jgi:hypothetical protein